MRTRRLCLRTLPDFTEGAGTASYARFPSATAWRPMRAATDAAASPNCHTTGGFSDATWRRWPSTGTCAMPSASATPAADTPRCRPRRCVRRPTGRSCWWIPRFSQSNITARSRWTRRSPCGGEMSGHRRMKCSNGSKTVYRSRAGGRRSCVTTAITACCRATDNSCSPVRPRWRRRSTRIRKSRGRTSIRRSRRYSNPCW